MQSFVSTQKQSVQRSMSRKFAQFISARGDNYELVLTVLRGMLRDQSRAAQAGLLPPGSDAERITSRCEPFKQNSRFNCVCRWASSQPAGLSSSNGNLNVSTCTAHISVLRL